MKVSIIIPVYNGSNYVHKAIESALEQTYHDKEIIVVNDGSNDDGATKIKVSKYFDKILYYEKTNGGVASALNVGIKKATGDYISWLSHDDVYHIDKIKTQIEILKKCPDKRVIPVCQAYKIDSEGRIFGTIENNFRYQDSVLQVFLTNTIHGCALLIPKDVVEECGYFNEALKTTQDYDLWFKAAFKAEFVFHNDLHVYSRIHPDQGAQKKKIRNKMNNDILRLNFSLKILFSGRMNFSTAKKFARFAAAQKLPLSLMSSVCYFFIGALFSSCKKLFFLIQQRNYFLCLFFS